MANTPAGIEIQAYINAELKARGIDAAATAVEGGDNLHLGIHIRGVATAHFMLDDACAEGLSPRIKDAIAEHLSRLQ